MCYETEGTKSLEVSSDTSFSHDNNSDFKVLSEGDLFYWMVNFFPFSPCFQFNGSILVLVRLPLL